MTFVAGLLKGYVGQQERNAARKEKQDLLNLQKKAMQADLDLKSAQATARKSVLDELERAQAGFISPQQLPQIPIQEGAGTVLQAGEGMVSPSRIQGGTPPSLLDLLSKSPDLQLQALKGGILDLEGLSKLQEKQRQMAFLGGEGGGMDMRQFSPGSISQARATGDIGLLRPSRREQVTVQGASGPEIRLIDKDRPGVGQLVGIPKEKDIAAAEGGRIAGVFGATKIVDDLKTSILDREGNVNPNFSMMDRANMDMATFGTEGRNMRFQFMDAIDSVIRARTGAAANKDEMSNMLKQFMPSVGDNDNTIKSKMRRLDAFLNNTLDITTLPSSIQKKIEARKKQNLKKPRDIPEEATLTEHTSGGKPVWRLPNGDFIVSSQ